ncbi:hypothetical protein WMF27_38550 [Sorangium sp. So ce281]|uniref:hypothetical protein n=1 Tax=unclassified Sorangium TaxID=2621164 RepID=UPI003F5E87C7
MTGMLRGGLWIGCAAAVVVTAAPASAMRPASEAFPAPAAPPSGSAVAPPAPAPGGAAAAPLLPPPAPGDGGAPPAGVAPPGEAPPSWTTSPGSWQPGGSLRREQRETERVWYGWQHLLVLSGTIAFGPLAVATENEMFAWMTAGPFVLGGPITHWANGHLGKGFLSLGLNVGCTFGGGLLGQVVGSASPNRDGEITGLVFGAILGALTANIVDATLLEYEEPPGPESYEYIRLRPLRLRFAPHVALAPGRTTFGLGGAF